MTQPSRHRSLALALDGTAVPIAQIGTEALRDFSVSFLQIENFMRFVLWSAATHDHVREVAAVALYNTGSPEDRRRMSDEWGQKPRGALDEIAGNRQFMLEVFLVRHVENYLGYLSRLLRVAYTQRPELMRSKRTITVENVLSYPDMPSLIHFLATDSVGSLSYKGFDDVVARFSEHNLLVVSEADIQIIREAIATRNISVHNRCIIDAQYIRQAQVSPERIGERRELYSHDLASFAAAANQSARSLDIRARRKWRLTRERFDAFNLLDQSAEASRPTTERRPSLEELAARGVPAK